MEKSGSVMISSIQPIPRPKTPSDTPSYQKLTCKPAVRGALDREGGGLGNRGQGAQR